MLEKNLKLLSELFKNKTPIYIVGGFIRDKLLSINSSDIDLCSNLNLSELENILKNSNFKLKIKNIKLGTAIIYNNEISFEYSVFRREIYSNNKQGKHNPEKIEFITELKEDALRRDFTINSLYYDICSNKLIDIFNARKDINNKLLRTVTTKTLNYDGERILRLIRFACELNFKIEEKTLISAQANAQNVFLLSKNKLEKFVNIFKTYSEEKKLKVTKLLNLFNLQQISKLI